MLTIKPDIYDWINKTIKPNSVPTGASDCPIESLGLLLFPEGEKLLRKGHARNNRQGFLKFV